MVCQRTSRSFLSLGSFRSLRVATAFAAGLLGAGAASADYQVLYQFLADGTAGYPGLTCDGAGTVYGATTYGGRYGCGTVFRIGADGSAYTVLHSFDCGSGGKSPFAAPTLDASGRLHGTTQIGGDAGAGTVWRMNVDGSGFEVTHAFGSGSDGAFPQAPLTFDGAGTLYGTTSGGGSGSGGTIFQIGTDGSSYLKRFDLFGANGSEPRGGLALEGSWLWGTTYYGGNSGFGVAFRYDLSGGGFTVIRHFSGSTLDGGNPTGQIVHYNGYLFGTTVHGGVGASGVLYQMNDDGGSFTLRRGFVGGYNEGSYPWGGVVLGPDLKLYGTASEGGPGNVGIVFRMSMSGAIYNVLHYFAGGTDDGRGPDKAVCLGGGNVFGMTGLGGATDQGVAYRMWPDGTNFSLLHSFRTGAAKPVGALARDASGNLYGVTQLGGANGLGSIFRLDPLGQLTLIRSLTATGYQPSGGPILASANLLYGTTFLGGAGLSGVAYRLQSGGGGWTELHDFGPPIQEGTYPVGELAFDGATTLYGATFGGGDAGGGTLFEIGTDGSAFNSFHSFGVGNDGTTVVAGPILGPGGYLYGTTEGGGGPGLGTIYRAYSDGSYALLHEFAGGTTDGQEPKARLTLGPPGILYGTTAGGGPQGAGTIFEITTTGSGFRLLHAFTFGAGAGAIPSAPVVSDASGFLYGSTVAFGPSGHGSVFAVTGSGADLRVVHAFTGTDGDLANELLLVPGALYGTTSAGGAFGDGVVFAAPAPGIFYDGFETGDTSRWSTP